MAIRSDLSISSIDKPYQQQNVLRTLDKKVLEILSTTMYPGTNVTLKKFLTEIGIRCASEGYPIRKIFLYGNSVFKMLHNEDCPIINIGLQFSNAITNDQFYSDLCKLPVAVLANLSQCRYADIVNHPSYKYRKYSPNSLVNIPFSPNSIALFLLREDQRADTFEKFEIELDFITFFSKKNSQHNLPMSEEREFEVDESAAEKQSHGLFRYCSLLTNGNRCKAMSSAERAYLKGFNSLYDLPRTIQEIEPEKRKSFLLNLERIIYCSSHEKKEEYLEIIRQELQKYTGEEIVKESLVYASPQLFDPSKPFDPNGYYRELSALVKNMPDPSLVYRDQELQLQRHGIAIKMEGCSSLLNAFWTTGKGNFRTVAIQNLEITSRRMPFWIEDFLGTIKMRNPEFGKRFAIVTEIVKKRPELEESMLKGLERALKKHFPTIEQVNDCVKDLSFMYQLILFRLLDQQVKVSNHEKAKDLLLDIQKRVIEFSTDEKKAFLKTFKKNPAVSCFFSHFFSFEHTLYLQSLESSIVQHPLKGLKDFLQWHEFLLYFVGAPLELRLGVENALMMSTDPVWKEIARERHFNRVLTLVSQELNVKPAEDIFSSLFSKNVLSTIEILNLFQQISRKMPDLQEIMLIVLEKELQISNKSDEKLLSTLLGLTMEMASPRRSIWISKLREIWKENALYHYVLLLTYGLKPFRHDLIEEEFLRGSAPQLNAYINNSEQKCQKNILNNLERIIYCSKKPYRQKMLARIAVEKKKLENHPSEGFVEYGTPSLPLDLKDYVNALQMLIIADDREYALRDQEYQLRTRNIPMALTGHKTLFEAFWKKEDIQWNIAALELISKETIEDVLPVIIHDARFSNLHKTTLIKIFHAAKEKKVLKEALPLFYQRAAAISDPTLFELFIFDPQVELVNNAFKEGNFNRVKYRKDLYTFIASREDRERCLEIQEHLLLHKGVAPQHFAEAFIELGSNKTLELLEIFCENSEPIKILQLFQRLFKTHPNFMEQYFLYMDKHILNLLNANTKIGLLLELWALLELFPASDKKTEWLRQMRNILKGMKEGETVKKLADRLYLHDPELPLNEVLKAIDKEIHAGNFERGSILFKIHYQRIFNQPFSNFSSVFMDLFNWLSSDLAIFNAYIDQVTKLNHKGQRGNALVELSTKFSAAFSDQMKIRLFQLYTNELQKDTWTITSKSRRGKPIYGKSVIDQKIIQTLLMNVLTLGIQKTPEREKLGMAVLDFLNTAMRQLKEFKTILFHYKEFIGLNFEHLPPKELFTQIWDLYLEGKCDDNDINVFVSVIGIYLRTKSADNNKRMEFLYFLNKFSLIDKSVEFKNTIINMLLEMVKLLKDSTIVLEMHHKFLEVKELFSKDKKLGKNISSAFNCAVSDQIERCTTIDELLDNNGPVEYLQKGISDGIFFFSDALELFEELIVKAKKLENGSEMQIYEKFRPVLGGSSAIEYLQRIVFYLVSHRILENRVSVLHEAFQVVSKTITTSDEKCLTMFDELVAYCLVQLMVAYLNSIEKEECIEKKTILIEHATILFKKVFAHHINANHASFSLEPFKDTQSLWKILLKNTPIPKIERLKNRENVASICHQLGQFAYETNNEILLSKVNSVRNDYFNSISYIEENVTLDEESPIIQPLDVELLPPVFKKALTSFPKLPKEEIAKIKEALEGITPVEAVELIDQLCTAIEKNIHHTTLEGCMALYKEIRKTGHWKSEHFYEYALQFISYYRTNRALVSGLWFHLIQNEQATDISYVRLAFSIISTLQDWELWLEHKERLLSVLNEKEINDDYTSLLGMFSFAEKTVPYVRTAFLQDVRSGRINSKGAIKLFQNIIRNVAKSFFNSETEKKGLRILYMLLQKELESQLNPQERASLARSMVIANVAFFLNGFEQKVSLEQAFQLLMIDIPEEMRRTDPIVASCMAEILRGCMSLSPPVGGTIGKIATLFVELFFKKTELTELSVPGYDQENGGDSFLQHVQCIMEEGIKAKETSLEVIIHNFIGVLAQLPHDNFIFNHLFINHFEKFKDQLQTVMIYTHLAKFFPLQSAVITFNFVIHLHYLRMVDSAAFPDDSVYSILKNLIASQIPVYKPVAKCYYHTIRHFLDKAAKFHDQSDQEKTMHYVVMAETLLTEGLMDYEDREQFMIAQASQWDKDVLWKNIFGSYPDDLHIRISSLHEEIEFYRIFWQK